MANSESSTRLKYSEGIDRITSLPEPLHSQILSLLPTKNAVATSILSTKWKFLWTSITNLSFDDGHYNISYSREVLIMKRQKFTQFVTSLLVLLNRPSIQNFSLRCHHDRCDPFYLQLWICAAIRRTIQMLELYLVLAKPMDLPLSHFNCKTLTVLKISGGDIHFNVVASASICFPNLLTLDLFGIRFTISRNGSVSFPRLKDLILRYVKYANEESVHKLFASCPVLDRLNIDRNLCDNVLCLVISIPSLQRLQIYCSGPILKGIGSLSENIAPVFRNLTRLTIGGFICHDWSFLVTNLLERTDNLESLSLMSEGRCCGSHESWWMEPSSVPMCLLRQVTKIDIAPFGDCSSVLGLVRYFLKNAEALELLTIYAYGSLEKRFQLMQKISMTPRGSRACQVKFR